MAKPRKASLAVYKHGHKYIFTVADVNNDRMMQQLLVKLFIYGANDDYNLTTEDSANIFRTMSDNPGSEMHMTIGNIGPKADQQLNDLADELGL
jgi:hypothetical protein